MSSSARKPPRPRREFTPEFKAEIVELVRRGERTLLQIALDFDLTETSVRVWVNQDKLRNGELEEADGPLDNDERAELRELRLMNRQLSEDVDILKRATAFFVRETR